MPKDILVWGLVLGVIAVGFAICTVLFERLIHQRKQAKYDALHRRMGLHANDHESRMDS
jgi:uncharacterized membrane protein